MPMMFQNKKKSGDARFFPDSKDTKKDSLLAKEEDRSDGITGALPLLEKCKNGLDEIRLSRHSSHSAKHSVTEPEDLSVSSSMSEESSIGELEIFDDCSEGKLSEAAGLQLSFNIDGSCRVATLEDTAGDQTDEESSNSELEEIFHDCSDEDLSETAGLQLSFNMDGSCHVTKLDDIPSAQTEEAVLLNTDEPEQVQQTAPTEPDDKRKSGSRRRSLSSERLLAAQSAQQSNGSRPRSLSSERLLRAQKSKDPRRRSLSSERLLAVFGRPPQNRDELVTRTHRNLSQSGSFLNFEEFKREEMAQHVKNALQIPPSGGSNRRSGFTKAQSCRSIQSNLFAEKVETKPRDNDNHKREKMVQLVKNSRRSGFTKAQSCRSIQSNLFAEKVETKPRDNDNRKREEMAQLVKNNRRSGFAKAQSCRALQSGTSLTLASAGDSIRDLDEHISNSISWLKEGGGSKNSPPPSSRPRPHFGKSLSAKRLLSPRKGDRTACSRTQKHWL